MEDGYYTTQDSSILSEQGYKVSILSVFTEKSRLSAKSAPYPHGGGASSSSGALTEIPAAQGILWTLESMVLGH